MECRIIKSPSKGTLDILFRRKGSPVTTEIPEYDAVGLVQGRLIDMSSGFLTIDQSSFEWELTGYEEIDFVVAGSLQLTINGITRRAVQGDVIFIPKGSRVTWQAEGFVKLFYTTYPADWADQMA